MFGLKLNRSLHKPLKSMCHRLVLSFRLRLVQFGLSGRYQPEEILLESVLRLKYALKMGKKIYNYEAWLRKTGFLYILEIWRRETKQASVNVDVNTRVDSVNNSPCDSIKDEQLGTEETYQLLDKIILKLPPSECELIMMRVYKNMSWDEIARKFANRGEVISVTTLRQRGYRAMRSLRKIYQEQMRLLSKNV